ncbi:MAG: rod shape-determining protein MreC [Acidobacteriota bacterium]|jgi:rod shape-determining protein MreC|nr:rod shape-determining protein MreC [Acidobacteriota bacterium]
MAVARTQKEIRQRAPWWFVGLLVFQLGLMAYDARDGVTKQRMIRVWAQALVSPFQNAASGVGGAGAGFFQWLGNLRNAAAENVQLKQRVEQMEGELAQLRANRDENERLKALLDFKEKSQYQIVTARVISRDPSVWFDTVTINRGSSSGLELNMPVVTPSGIVGRVITLSPWTAQIMLITDEHSGAGAVVGQLGQSNALGSVKGLGHNGLLEMGHVSGLEVVNPGDYVLTTGQDSIYPPGLNVGEVVEVKPGTATVPLTIYIKPGAHLNALEEVAVLLYHPPQIVAPDQVLPNVEKKK